MKQFQMATAEDYKCLHPDYDYVPPMVTQDGAVTAVGTAHGRTIPVIGSTRPPVFDVSLHPFDGGDVRVYGDDANDVLAVICGEHYQKQLMVCRNISDEYSNLDDDSEDADQRRVELSNEFITESTFLGMIRGAFAHQARQVAQGIINTEAQNNGQWDALTEAEREVLTMAADTTSRQAPVGILKDYEFVNPDNPDDAFIGKRGTWTADVPLVLNESDYYPWSDVPRPLSTTLVTAPDGTVYEDSTSDLNVRNIRVETAEGMLEDLSALHVIDMTVRPAIPVDAAYRDLHEEAVAQRLERNRRQREADGADQEGK